MYAGRWRMLRRKDGAREMVRFIQINLNRSPAAQDMMFQTAIERNVDMLLISEQNKRSENRGWLTDRRNDAAILILPRARETAKMIERGNGYIRCVIGDTAVYSCYYSPNRLIEAFKTDLEELEDSVRQWTGPVVIAGDFNAKSKSWSNGPEDKRRKVRTTIKFAKVGIEKGNRARRREIRRKCLRARGRARHYQAFRWKRKEVYPR